MEGAAFVSSGLGEELLKGLKTGSYACLPTEILLLVTDASKGQVVIDQKASSTPAKAVPIS